MKEYDEESLTELFRKLGAIAPESWASSEIKEDIPQLCRFLFLREAWKLVVSEDDTKWMGPMIDPSKSKLPILPEEPFSGTTRALRRCIAAGAKPEDLNELVRGKQAELLCSICYLIDDPGLVDEELSDICWGLFQLDEDGAPVRNIGGLHESVLETDPTGREMRPKPGE